MRRTLSLAILLTVISSVVAWDTGMAATQPVCPKDGVLCISSYTRVLVTPSRLPPTRLRVSFDGEHSEDWPGATGKHSELEWDPAQPSRLPRVAHLGPGLWRVSFFAEPLPLTVSDPQRAPVYLSIGFKPTNKSDTELSTEATIHYLSERTKVTGATEERALSEQALGAEKGAYGNFTVTTKVLPLPTLDEAAGGLSASEGGGMGGRSIDSTASQAVNELFAILAEVAYEQASSRTFRVLTDRLTTLACTELRLNQAVPDVNGVLGVLLAPPKDGVPYAAPLKPQEVLLLPNTCASIRSLRMEDLATSGGALLDALQRDVLWLATTAMLERIKTPGGGVDTPEQLYARRLLTQLAIALGHQLSSNRSLDIRQAQLLLLDATQHGWTSTDAKPYTCGLQLAFAAMAQCHAAGRCDARQVMDLVRRPERYFDLSSNGCGMHLASTDAAAVAKLREVWPDLEQLVERGLQILQPTGRSTPREHMRLTVDLGLDLIERGAVSSDDQQLATLLKDVRLILQGIADQDAQPVLVAAGRIVRRRQLELCRPDSEGGEEAQRICGGRLTADFTRASHLMAAVGSYVRTYSSGPKGDPKQLEAAREARKNSIRSLIQATTDRTQRDGDGVVSLGAAVGVSGGWQRLDFRENEALLPQLSLPVGIAYQRLPDARLASGWRWIGWHAQFSFADLGQYVTYRPGGDVTPARWDTALMVGLQAGVLVGTSQDLFLIGPDIRYSPTLFLRTGEESGGGALRVGLTAAYYVPFFDFN